MRLLPVLTTLASMLIGEADAASPAPDAVDDGSAADGDDEPAETATLVAPLIGYDSNLKLGVGAFGQIVWADPTGDTPFRARLGAQAYATTGGLQDHVVYWDLPDLLQTRLRWDARVRYRSWSRAPYFGVGASPSRLPAEDVADDYYLWDSTRLLVQTNVRRAVGLTPWETYASLVVNLQEVERYPGSLLERERPSGVEGGTTTVVGLGGFRDTRSNEIDPADGSVVDLQIRGSSPWVGSTSEWWGVHASLRRWWSVHDRIVLAGRSFIDGTFGDTPFFQQTYMGGLQRGAYGGRFFLRGLAEERLRVDAIGGVQAEVRWRFVQFTLFRNVDIALQLVPFVDAGQAWDVGGETDIDPWITGGAGLRMNLKELLVVRADAGVASERYSVGDPRRPQAQIYILADHPF